MNHAADCVRFSEVMTGAIAWRQQSAPFSYDGDTPLTLHLSVTVADMRGFLADPEHTATLTGWVHSTALGGKLAIERGTCSFFPRDKSEREEGLRYWMTFADGAGNPFTLFGVKYLRNGAPGRVWADTTTLYVRLLEGHLDVVRASGQEGVATGIVRMRPLAFARELTTFRAEGPSPGARLRALLQYFAFFIRGLRDAHLARR